MKPFIIKECNVFLRILVLKQKLNCQTTEFKRHFQHKKWVPKACNPAKKDKRSSQKKARLGRRKSPILTTLYVLSCTDLDTRMAPTELRVPEAMIALDLWLPAVQEVAVNFLGDQVEKLVNQRFYNYDKYMRINRWKPGVSLTQASWVPPPGCSSTAHHHHPICHC